MFENNVILQHSKTLNGIAKVMSEPEFRDNKNVAGDAETSQLSSEKISCFRIFVFVLLILVCRLVKVRYLFKVMMATFQRCFRHVNLARSSKNIPFPTHHEFQKILAPLKRCHSFCPSSFNV